MKKKIFILTIAAMLISALIVPATVLAAKPAGNLASAQKVTWNLSAAVMPVPPYGSHDIPGSDTASKLIVNQPNGMTEITITGAMNGLNPNTTYTVYLSKGYTPYVYTGWNVVGTWVLRFNLGGNYDHDITILVQSDGIFSGTGGYPASGPPYSITETVTGTINVMTGAVTLHSVYNNGYWYDAVGTIASDGTMSGTWGNTSQGYGHSWFSISGNAVKTHISVIIFIYFLSFFSSIQSANIKSLQFFQPLYLLFLFCSFSFLLSILSNKSKNHTRLFAVSVASAKNSY